MFRAGGIFFVIVIFVLLFPGAKVQIAISNLSFGYVGASQETTTILFVGDIMLGRYTETLINEFGTEYPLRHVAAFLDSYDMVVANLEAPVVSNHVQTPNNSFLFSTPTSALLAISKQITHVSLANNHTNDFGEESFLYTETELAKVGIIPLGHPLFVSTTTVTSITHAELRIDIVGINMVSGDTEEAVSKVMSLNTGDAIQIVSIHWGDEYVLTHNSEQEQFARALIDAGADVIIGHHPHVVQDINVYRGVPIFYSLGNFIFDQYFSDDVMDHLGVEIKMVNKQMQFRLIPFTSRDSKSAPELMTVDEKEVFLQALSLRSNPRLQASILRGSFTAEEILATY